MKTAKFISILFLITLIPQQVLPIAQRYDQLLPIDATVMRSSKKSFFFCGNQWVKWKTKDSKINKGPYKITEHDYFEKLPSPFNKKINAAVIKEQKKCFFFSEDQWLLWNLKKKKIEEGPYKIEKHDAFKNLPNPFNKKIDSAVLKKKNKCYFFSGNEWLLWNLKENKIKEGPYKFNNHKNFEKLPFPFNKKIDAALSINSKNFYLFSDDEWILWDSKNHKIKTGPHKISEHKNFKELEKLLKPTFMQKVEKATSKIEDAIKYKDELDMWMDFLAFLGITEEKRSKQKLKEIKLLQTKAEENLNKFPLNKQRTIKALIKLIKEKYD